MLKQTLIVAVTVFALSGAAWAQDDSAGALDDATDIVGGMGDPAAGMDDADADSSAGLAGVAAASGPLAYGTVQSNGAKYDGTANWSSSYNGTYTRYEIAISGQSYYYLNYATVITPAGDQRFCRSSSVGGKLLVYCYDHAGNAQQSRFGFITFKP